MINLSHNNIHNRFKLNGKYLNSNELCEIAYSYIKEGLDFEKTLGLFILEWFDANNYIELTTSGSTGKPKTIKLLKKAMIASAIATGDFFNLKPGNTSLHCLPSNFIAGKMMLVRALILGLELDVVNPSLYPLKNNKKKYQFAAMVPLQVENSICEINLIEKIIIGGALLSKSLKVKLLSSKSEIYETYGMTETITHIAAKRVGETAFKVLPNITISVNHDNCLQINAPRINKSIIITTDVVEIVGKNSFIWKGRLDNVINSGGIKLYPEEIEEKLSNKINTRFFVSSINDEILGSKLILVIEGENYNLDTSVFLDFTKYQIPKEVYLISKFKETPTGKVKRKETLLLLDKAIKIPF